MVKLCKLIVMIKENTQTLEDESNNVSVTFMDDINVVWIADERIYTFNFVFSLCVLWTASYRSVFDTDLSISWVVNFENFFFNWQP